MFENELASCIYHWLNYKDSTCKTSLIAESSIRYPLAEFLERKLSASVILEKVHPLFQKRRFDFFYDHKSNGKKLSGYIEIKIVRGNTKDESEIQRIFNDLMRLAYCSSNHYNYFILCGKTTDFNCYFKTQQSKGLTFEDIFNRSQADHRLATSIYSHWFPFERGEEVSFTPSRFPQYEEFKKKYVWRNNLEEYDLSTIKTILVESLPRGYDIDKSQSVYIWKVKGTRARKKSAK